MEKIIVVDFGGQYNQLIARRVRDLGVYCEIVPYTIDMAKLAAMQPAGLIFTGGPNSVYLETSPHISDEIFGLNVPILGICYGCQILAYMLGGTVSPAETAAAREYGKTETDYLTGSKLFDEGHGITWMSHGDYISKVPEGFKITAKTPVCPVAAMECDEKRLYGVQFHLEVNHTVGGIDMLRRFLFDVCGCKGEWKMDSFIDTTVAELKRTIGDKGVVLGLSGGVDSSVAAALLSKAVGKQLTCVFVDQGLMRKDEGDMVEQTFTKLFDMNFVRINCQQHFYDCLKGVSDPEQKRKIIGTEFYRVFWDKIRESYGDGFFAQGTIYPDRIESGKGDAAVIKTHHNQVKQPDDIKFLGTIEPLKDLFKDEVRRVGEMLGMILPLVLMFVVFYFLLIRPQKKKDKKVKEMLAALKNGDRVCTIGGISGTITSDLAEADLGGMISDIDHLVSSSEDSVQNALNQLNSIDIDTLNQAINHLNDTVTPFANFFNKFR